jgi:hypothetical protein
LFLQSSRMEIEKKLATGSDEKEKEKTRLLIPCK